MLPQTPEPGRVILDEASVSVALDAVAACRRICEDTRRSRRELAEWARAGWQGRMRDLVDTELAELDAELEGSLAALVELEAAIVAYREQALELRSELERRVTTLAGSVEPSAR